ncbi:hypothetical protein L0337_42410 [candidate division KSB1 bacterium]|nr:hypothetical protein [candidate division KSB1 bacterium]
MNDTNGNLDRLYDLLPVVYRQRDSEQGLPLKAFLRIITEQANVVDHDIAKLYENWFIETCDDWVVPYIADLVGYEPVHEAGQPREVTTEHGRLLNKILIPRREVANTIRNRRRKGTLALLELLARDVANWPARAVEFFTLLSITQSLNHLRFLEPSFKITDRALQELQTEGLSTDLLERLATLKNHSPAEEEKFLKQVQAAIGVNDAARHKDLLLAVALYKDKTIARGKTVDLRNGDALSRLNGPFDEIAHTVDVRRPNSRYSQGRYNIPSIGLFVWRLRAYSMTQAPAFCQEGEGQNLYSFSVLGNDAPLFTRTVPEDEPTQIAGELNLPIPIRRKALEENKEAYYGESKSFQIWLDDQAITVDQIVAADLSDWQFYKTKPGFVAVDPALGRIAFPSGTMPTTGVTVSYYYGFSTDIGGGEYFRQLSQPTLQSMGDMLLQASDLRKPRDLVLKLRKISHPLSEYFWQRFSEDAQRMLQEYDEKEQPSDAMKEALLAEVNRILQDECTCSVERFQNVKPLESVHSLIDLKPEGAELIYLNRILFDAAFGNACANLLKIYRVGRHEEITELHEAIELWKKEQPCHAIIEIVDNEEYGAPRAINIELGPRQTLQIRAANRKRPTIRLLDVKAKRPDALNVKGAPGSRFTLDGLLITGRSLKVEGELDELNIRHTTLVPGWTIDEDCEPQRPTERSILLFNTTARVTVEHCIIGSIQVIQDRVAFDPLTITISDSILDATAIEGAALSAPECEIAHAILTILRTTVIGEIHTHAIDLGENCLFTGKVQVARRQHGCIRFSYVKPGSRTPRRFNCQPDVVEMRMAEASRAEGKGENEIKRDQERERARVSPQFNSVRYGEPDYCQLTDGTAEEIKRGADDESEMGAFHDLFQPQREANLRTRLEEYTPAGMNAGIIFAS